jgi:HlyD family secretion protein
MDQDNKIIQTEPPKEGEQQDVLSSQPGNLVPARPSTDLPAIIPKRVHKTNWRLRAVFLLILILAGAGGTYYWWRQHQQLPPSIVWSNGRIEADEIDIDTKYAGRIAELFADEGTMVKAGQVVARMDTRDLEASLKKSEAQVRQAQKAVDEAFSEAGTGSRCLPRSERGAD